MLFSVYALFLFILTAFVAAAPAGSSHGSSGVTVVGAIRLESKATYVSGGTWTQQGTPLVSRLFCRMVNLYLTHLTGRSGRYHPLTCVCLYFICFATACNYPQLHKQQLLQHCTDSRIMLIWHVGHVIFLYAYPFRRYPYAPFVRTSLLPYQYHPLSVMPCSLYAYYLVLITVLSLTLLISCLCSCMYIKACTCRVEL